MFASNTEPPTQLLSFTIDEEQNNSLTSATEESYIRPFTDTGIIVSAVILLTFLVVGLFGNVVTVIVILKNKELKNIFSDFILSLCISDLWSTTISWLFLYRRTWGFDDWSPLPGFLCKFYWASDLMTNYVTAWHILSFAVLRYLSCQFPLKFALIKRKHGKIVIVSIWVISFVVGFVPFAIFFEARTVNRKSGLITAKWPACTIILEWLHTSILYQQICYALLIFLPMFCLVVVSILLVRAVLKQSKKFLSTQNERKKRKKERQAVLQVILIVFSYLMGYIPFTAYQFWALQPRPKTLYYRQFDYWFGMTEYYFLRFSECLNPLFYNLGSSKMRFYTKTFLRKYFCCCCPEESCLCQSDDSKDTKDSAVGPVTNSSSIKTIS